MSRSFLLVPGDSENTFAKATESGADMQRKRNSTALNHCLIAERCCQV